MLIVANPCFGLDFVSVADIRAQIVEQRNRGAAVLLVSEDLDEVLLKANSAKAALEHLLKNDVAVILVDVCMPDLDGFELAAMIREDLSNVDGCPEIGVTVTVYGLNPWNSMLTFGAAAGPVRNKAELQRFCEIITSRLQRLYDITF